MKAMHEELNGWPKDWVAMEFIKQYLQNARGHVAYSKNDETVKLFNIKKRGHKKRSNIADNQSLSGMSFANGFP